MSSIQRIDTYQTFGETDRNPRKYGFLVALTCVVVALAIASILFIPVDIGAGTGGEILLIGP